MSKIRVNTNALDQQAQQIKEISRILDTVIQEVGQANKGLSWKISSHMQIRHKLNQYVKYIGELDYKTRKLSSSLYQVKHQYEKTENKTVTLGEKLWYWDLFGERPTGLIPRDMDWMEIWDLLQEAYAEEFYRPFHWKAPFGILLSGLTFATLSPSYVTGLLFGKAMGVSSETSFSKSGPGFSIKGSMSAEWSPEKGNAGATIKGSASGSLFTGSMKAQNGLSSASGEIKVGNAAVSGEGKAQLFKDGKLSPEISAKVSGEVSAVKGKIETKTGTDDYNVHGKAEGELLGAKAEAKAGVGKITYKDKEGNTKTGYGVEGSVGAEAYVAQGKVSGGFTIAGIKIGVSVSGKAGGAGVSAGGRVTTGGISGEIGAGLGLGAGIKLDVDWTDFVFFRKKK